MDQVSFDAITNRLGEVMVNTQLASCSPNISVVNEALGFDVAKLQSVDGNTLSTYIIVLSQYAIYLQAQYNLMYVSFVNNKKLYDHTLHKFMLDDSRVRGKTIAEKEFVALTLLPRLGELKHKLDMADAERLMLQDIDKSLKLLIEALKKELGRRYDEMTLSRGRSS